MPILRTVKQTLLFLPLKDYYHRLFFLNIPLERGRVPFLKVRGPYALSPQYGESGAKMYQAAFTLGDCYIYNRHCNYCWERLRGGILC